MKFGGGGAGLAEHDNYIDRKFSIVLLQLFVQVRTASPLMDLTSVAGRLDMVCTLIQCYRLQSYMASILPCAEQRQQLWRKVERGFIDVTLNPTGALKEIQRFKAFAKAASNSEQILRDAYEAAASAAAKQKQEGLGVALVTAALGPEVRRDYYMVQTTPLGYNSRPATEQVSLDTQHVSANPLVRNEP